MDIPFIKSGFLARLGSFTFEPKGLSFQRFERDSSYSWAMLQRIGMTPLRQFIGMGGEKIAISGSYFPHFKGGFDLIPDLRAMATLGIPQLLIAGDRKSAENLGRWIILSIKETRSHFRPDGTPEKIDFSLELESYG